MLSLSSNDCWESRSEREHLSLLKELWSKFLPVSLNSNLLILPSMPFLHNTSISWWCVCFCFCFCVLAWPTKLCDEKFYFLILLRYGFCNFITKTTHNRDFSAIRWMLAKICSQVWGDTLGIQSLMERWKYLDFLGRPCLKRTKQQKCLLFKFCFHFL